MNTTASFLPEPSWIRRCSTETVFSIQGRETDIVQDSSDSEWGSDDAELEPITGSEEEAPISGATSGQSDDELITKALVVSAVGADSGDLQLADSERSAASDSEQELPQYGACARCHAPNQNKRYRYCDKCFKLRKNFFPPRPRRRGKAESSSQESLPSTMSQDSGVDSLPSQELPSSQDLLFSQESTPHQDALGQGPSQELSQDTLTSTQDPHKDPSHNVTTLGKLKRRSESADRAYKRPRLEAESDHDSGAIEVAPLVKTISDPAVTIESLDGGKDNLCIICLTEPKSGVFVHRRVAHICCCYNCAVKVWSKARRCPICNCKVSNVLKAVM